MHQPKPPAPGSAHSQAFTARLEQRLASLYGRERAAEIAGRILGAVESHRRLRPPRCLKPTWDESEVVLITYGNSLQSPGEPPLQSLKRFLDTYLKDSFSLVHVLPFFPYSSDDGFSVTDFRAVNPELGTWDDILAVGKSFDLGIDLVLNHCSREHLWFVDFVHGDQPGADYFIETDPKANLSMVVRPRTSPLLTKVRTPRGLRHLWATFSNDQIDLNYANPDVLLEMVDIVFDYLRRGARLLRLDEEDSLCPPGASGIDARCWCMLARRPCTCWPTPDAIGVVAQVNHMARGGRGAPGSLHGTYLRRVPTARSRSQAPGQRCSASRLPECATARPRWASCGSGE